MVMIFNLPEFKGLSILCVTRLTIEQATQLSKGESEGL